MEVEPIVIKKYENRRLYNTDASRYINLEGVAELVREGRKLQVIESKTGDDITRQVLTQIIVERAKGDDEGPPIEFLRDMVRASDRAYRDFLHWYLRGAADVYERLRKAWERSPAASRTPLIDWSSLLDPATAARNLSQLWQDPFRRAFDRSRSASAEPGQEGAVTHEKDEETPENRDAERSELADLRRRLEELEARLSD